MIANRGSAVGGVSERDACWSTVLLVGLYDGVMEVDVWLVSRLDGASDDAEGRFNSRRNWADVGLLSGLDGTPRCPRRRSDKLRIR